MFLLHAYLPPKKWIELFDWTPFMNSSIFIFLMCSNTAQQKHMAAMSRSLLCSSPCETGEVCEKLWDQVGWWCQLIFCLARSVTHLPSGKLSCHGEVSRNVKKWRFPEIGLPLVIIHFRLGSFPIHLGTSIFRKPPYLIPSFQSSGDHHPRAFSRTCTNHQMVRSRLSPSDTFPPKAMTVVHFCHQM